MKYTLRLLVVTLIGSVAFILPEVLGQVSINYPKNREVFQRDKNNSATIYIAGSYSEAADRVEAQLVPVQGGNHSGWITIQNNPQGGQFYGSLDWSGGWYTLEVRMWRGGQQVGSASLSRVGIGEVFLIAGQSNAQGYQGYGARGAGDDRVNTINYYNNDGPNDNLPEPEFSHLNDNSFISPRGNSAWSWGRLGDQLANRLGVPILFYNAAWYGTSIKNWRDSIHGTAYGVFDGSPYPQGMPYANLRLAMQYYVPLTGVRGVLWHQGESDTYTNTSASTYANDLRTVIEQSRNESGKNLSWVIARVSYFPLGGGTSGQVIQGQNNVASSVPNTFYGPETDNIPNHHRSDGIHFANEGLVILGDMWNNALNDDFFNRSEPYKAQPLPRVTVNNCSNENNTLTLTVEGNYSAVNWNNGAGDRTITVGPGTFKARVRDGAGNVMYTPEIRIPDNVRASSPNVTIEGRNPICQNGTTVLSANSSGKVTWNNGQNEERITVSAAGEFFATVQNAYGCQATSSRVAVTVLPTPPPATPSITVTAPTTFCEGGEVKLVSSAPRNAWSNGMEGKEVAIRTSGEYRVRAVDEQGCFSSESAPVAVVVNPLPAQPVISASSNTTFCQGGNVTLTSSYSSGNMWSTQATAQAITVAQTGSYTVRVRDANGCENTSRPVDVKVNPLPAAPSITPLRPTTFCDRDYTVLQSSPEHMYRWSTGHTGREHEIRTPGDYSLTVTDINGCTSPASSVVKVVVNPLPASPTITAAGPTTFCADDNVLLQSTPALGYLWSHGESSKDVSVNKTAEYSVQARNEFGCLSDPSNRIRVNALPLPPMPTVTAQGPTSFCDGDEVILSATGIGPVSWNTGVAAPTITVTQTGNYAARVQGTNGCFSPYTSSLRVVAHPIPEKPVIRQAGTFTLEAENAVEAERYEWKRDGATIQDEGLSLIKAGQSGTYSVRGFVVHSPTLTCSSVESELFRFEVDMSTGGFSIYPNPSIDGLVTFETLQDLQNATVQLYDLRGNLVHTFTSLSFEERKVVDLSTLPDGVYIVRIEAGTFTAVRKVILAR
ncbi:sialate O-acetylesterase [Telluribacter sp. SYSU D00476]|uniref:sialate O-acetylesterase n=1 Tax=Telluribacter sp. SYSU D00476 TaxID=2811430 RepID=UPI001FF34564|nr:sialate O-acetylesterase [Telluribacter sp. SYSU D00476]